jgi:hypothetical protein
VSLRGRCALILGISDPDPKLGEPELGAPAPLANAPVQAEALTGLVNTVTRKLGGVTIGVSPVNRAVAAVRVSPQVNLPLVTPERPASFVTGTVVGPFMVDEGACVLSPTNG